MKNRVMLRRLSLILSLSIGCVVSPSAPGADDSTATGAARCLSDFGPIGTIQEAEATLREASLKLQAAGGGVLLIPTDAPAGWRPVNITQEVWRRPDPPAPATGWGIGPGVTLIDLRRGVLDLHLPQLDGMRLTRTMNLPDGQSSPHWSYHPMVRLENSIVRGAVSYRDWLQDDVEAGEDRRFYVNTLRGIFPGAFLNTGDHGGVSRLYVKSLGYDTERNMGYFVADVDRDIRKGAIIHNKTHANVMRMDTYGHTEDQTFDVMNWRHDYSQGDTYMYDARFNYMGDCHSTAGDENAVLYAAFVVGNTAIFRGRIESWDAATHELKYTGAQNAHTLGTGRPIINLNPDKWIAGDDVIVVRPGHWYDVDVPGYDDPVFEGETYPTRIIRTDIGTTELRMGGLIRFPAGSPVDARVVGRYFAVDEPGEHVPRGTEIRRWYRIHDFDEDPDGLKTIRIVRHWWGAKPAGAPTLYREEHYSRDGHVRPLRYVIAPGANVYDVSRGTRSTIRYSAGALDRIVKLTPESSLGGDVDFAPEDRIEQAIGPDPFRPLPFRSWMFENVPGAWPAPVLDIANHSAIQRHSVLTVAGGGASLDTVREQRHDARPAWKHYIELNSTAENGFVFAADIANAAILFRQPNQRPQPITWLYGEDHREATLTVDPTDGVMRFDGAGVAAPGGLTELGGLSGTRTPARNLRGIAVAVAAGSSEITVAFDRPEPDDAYAVFVEMNWMSVSAVSEHTQTGFKVRFATPPEIDGRLDWLLVR